jgi:hypothetical protein
MIEAEAYSIMPHIAKLICNSIQSASKAEDTAISLEDPYWHPENY